MRDLLSLIVQIARFFAPWSNQTPTQRVGTIVSVVAVIAGAVASILLAMQPPVGGPTGTAPSVTPPALQDVYEVPDVSKDQGAAPGTVEAILGELCLGCGCSPAQRKAWTAFGTETRDCLLAKCHAPEIMVVGMQGGAWGDLLMEDLPCVLGCLGTGVAGAIEVARGEDRQTATWFGTSSEVRTIPTVRVRITPR